MTFSSTLNVAPPSEHSSPATGPPPAAHPVLSPSSSTSTVAASSSSAPPPLPSMHPALRWPPRSPPSSSPLTTASPRPTKTASTPYAGPKLSQSDPYPVLRGRADFSRCFLMGTSAGSNIAMQLGLLLHDLEPPPEIGVVGMIVDQPYFGGVERTESEKRLENDKILPLPANDLMWELALPEGADRDHEYCNLPKPIERGRRRYRKKLPGLYMVRGYMGDLLLDRQRDLARVLEKEGASVAAMLDRDGFHCVELFDPREEEASVDDVSKFVNGGGSSGAFAGKTENRSCEPVMARHRRGV